MLRAKNKSGFTLIEIIIVITVLLIVMGGASVIMHQMASASARQSQQRREQAAEEPARLALLNIVRDARLSHNIMAHGAGTLVLNSNLADGSPVTITYGITNNMLTRSVTFDDPPGNEVPVGPDVNQWPNPFSPVAVDGANGFETEPYEPGSSRLVITIRRPGAPRLESEVSLNRRPS